jgi:membrane protein required for colicin V production
MNYIDIILIILLLLAAFNGFRKGLITEVASLAALVLGVWGAIEFSYITSEFLTEKMGWEPGNLNIISFIITFIVIVILVHLVGNSLSKLVEAAMLGWANRITGLIFGVAKTAFILSILLLIFNKIDEDVHILSQKTKMNSQLYEPMRKFAPSVFPFISNWENEKRPQGRSKDVV